MNKILNNKNVKGKEKKYIFKIITIIIILFVIFNEQHCKLYLNSKEFALKNYICMCSIVKEENIYLKDFINHYKLLGYNHFYIYDNNDISGERLEDVISEEIKNGFVSIINFRNYRPKNKGPQMDAYYNCYHKNKNNCKWISFFDIDEFLIIDSKNITLSHLLENLRYKKCDGLSVNWKLFHDNNLLIYENLSVIKRFKGIKENCKANTPKLIARGNIHYNLEKADNSHTIWKNIKLCNTLGKRIEQKFSKTWITPHCYKYAYLNHSFGCLPEFPELPEWKKKIESYNEIMHFDET